MQPFATPWVLKSAWIRLWGDCVLVGTDESDCVDRVEAHESSDYRQGEKTHSSRYLLGLRDVLMKEGGLSEVVLALRFLASLL